MSNATNILFDLMKKGVPTPEDISTLRMHNPIIAACWNMHLAGQIDYDQMLRLMIVSLAWSLDATENELISERVSSPPRPFFPLDIH